MKAKVFVLIAIALFLVGCITINVTVVNGFMVGKPAHIALIYPVVRITSGMDAGSGTIIYSKINDKEIYSTYVLTNNHVIEGMVTIAEEWDSDLQETVKKEKRGIVYVEIFQYKNVSIPVGTLKIEAEIIIYNKDEDMALVKLSSEKKAEYIAELYPRNRTDDIFVMDETIAVGCSLAFPPLPTTGILTRKNFQVNSLPYHMSSSQIIYGNCLPSTNYVITDQGVKTMGTLRIGDKVFTPVGPRKIDRIYPEQKKPVVAIKTKSRTLEASTDHPVMCLIKTGTKTGPNHRNEWETVWKSAGDIGPGDILVVMDSVPDTGKSYILPDGRETTENFMQLVGCFLGDGYVRIRQHEGGQFSLCLFDDDDIATYSQLTEEWFGRPLRTDRRGAHLYSVEAARYIDSIGLNRKSYEKILPDWVWTLPHEQIRAMFVGLRDSDGTITPNGAWSYEMNNERLIRQLHALAQMVGYRTSNVTVRFRDKPNPNNKGMLIEARRPAAFFQIYPDAQKRLTVDGSGYYGAQYAVLPPNCGLERVSKVEKRGLMPVMDIGLENVYVFFAGGVLVHNSGGAMFLDATGEFIGIPSLVPVVGWGTPITHMGLFIPIDRIYDWLEKEHYDFLFDSTKTEKACLELRKKEIGEKKKAKK